jgi:hypothetical protein
LTPLAVAADLPPTTPVVVMAAVAIPTVRTGVAVMVAEEMVEVATDF